MADEQTTCPGPLIWYAVTGNGAQDEAGALLECAACDYVIATGSFHDGAHADTPLLREGT